MAYSTRFLLFLHPAYASAISATRDKCAVRMASDRLRIGQSFGGRSEMTWRDRMNSDSTVSDISSENPGSRRSNTNVSASSHTASGEGGRGSTLGAAVSSGSPCIGKGSHLVGQRPLNECGYRPCRNVAEVVSRGHHSTVPVELAVAA